MDNLEQRTVGRRRFLAYAGATALAAGTGELLQSPQQAQAAAATVVAYFLDPEWGASDPDCPEEESLRAGSCHGCNACHGHAVKFFTSAAVADTTRAHVFCKCLVGSTELDAMTAVAIFGPPKGPFHRDEFDRRRDELFLPALRGAGR